MNEWNEMNEWMKWNESMNELMGVWKKSTNEWNECLNDLKGRDPKINGWMNDGTIDGINELMK